MAHRATSKKLKSAYHRKNKWADPHRYCYKFPSLYKLFKPYYVLLQNRHHDIPVWR